MYTVKEIEEKLFSLAPPELKMDYDNVGLLVGKSTGQVTRALISLDITDEVVEEAVRLKAELIVSHHPLFFSLTNITDEDRLGRKAVEMIENGISAICMHTNLDAANGGVCDALAAAAGLSCVEHLTAEGVDKAGAPFSYGRVGVVPVAVSLREYIAELKAALSANGIRFHDL